MLGKNSVNQNTGGNCVLKFLMDFFAHTKCSLAVLPFAVFGSAPTFIECFRGQHRGGQHDAILHHFKGSPDPFLMQQNEPSVP